MFKWDTHTFVKRNFKCPNYQHMLTLTTLWIIATFVFCKSFFSEEDIQLTRLMDRNHLSEADAKKRIKQQMPLEQKCNQSHFVVENSGMVKICSQKFSYNHFILPPQEPSKTRKTKPWKYWTFFRIAISTGRYVVSSLQRLPLCFPA